MRIDRAVARAAAMFGNVTARKHIWDDLDLSPYDRAMKESESADLSIDNIFGVLSAAAKKTVKE